MNKCAFKKIRAGAADSIFARGASHYEARKLVRRRGSRQSKQALGRLPSSDSKVLPLIPFYP